jgi:hypothetical protein
MSVTRAPASHGRDLARLDALARQPYGGETEESVLALVERVAGRPHGLDDLVRRYATAANALLPRAVSFVLAQLGSDPSPQTWESTRKFAERARGSHDPSTLINVLTAVQRQMGADSVARPASPEPELTEFILHCLAQPPIVRSLALDLLVVMATDDALRPFLPRSAIPRLRRVLQDLGAAGAIAERDERGLLAALERAA